MKYLIQLMMKLGLTDYMAKQLAKPQGFFGSRLIGKMMNRGNNDLELCAFNCASFRSTDHVLEIGFGNGKQLQKICETITEGKTIGVDISEDLVDQVSKRLNAFIRSGKLELHLAGVSELPLADNSIDCIITCNTIYFWPDPLADAKELLRVLKPGGKMVCGYRTIEEMEAYPFVCNNLDIFKNRYTDNEVKQLFLDAGFTEVNIKVEPSDLAPSHVSVAVK